LKKYFSGAKTMLEVGCGTGYQLMQVNRELPLLVSGSEFFADGLAFAVARCPGVEMYQADARDLPFTEEFDVVGAFDVLEHIEEDDLCLKEFFRAVRRGGGIVLTVPQHRMLWSEADVIAGHVRRYTAGELRRKVASSGFEVVRMTSFVALLFPAMIASRLLRRRPSPFTELEVSGRLNAALEKVMSVERAVIRSGAYLPFGGSLLLVARKR
jgi:ubiquinone/menaquinone biosynthesis C-methylase UbiE